MELLDLQFRIVYFIQYYFLLLYKESLAKVPTLSGNSKNRIFHRINLHCQQSKFAFEMHKKSHKLNITSWKHKFIFNNLILQCQLLLVLLERCNKFTRKLCWLKIYIYIIYFHIKTTKFRHTSSSISNELRFDAKK